jgi:hypothetical protein
VELDIEKWAGTKKEGEADKLQKVWKTKGESKTMDIGGKKITRPFYLSVNAVTLEPSDDTDLRMWHNKGWIFYVENLTDNTSEKMRVGEPYEGGMY